MEKGRREQEGIKGRRRGTRFRDRAMLRKGTSDRTFILAFEMQRSLQQCRSERAQHSINLDFWRDACGILSRFCLTITRMLFRPMAHYFYQ